MLQFTSIPTQFSALDAPLNYTLSGLTDGRVQLNIYTDEGRLLATKRLIGNGSCTVDLAPIVRRAAAFTPAVASTGFVASADRTLTMRVEAISGSERVTSAARTILFAWTSVTLPAICSTLPMSRLIAPEACDEVSFVAADPRKITVTAESPTAIVSEEFSSPEQGLQCFRLVAADYPEAEQITLTVEGIGQLHYTVAPPNEGAVTLAWRSSAGSIEHYTFPIVEAIRLLVDKERACGAAGYSLTSVEVEERWQLHSAYETAQMMRALSELLYAEQVWRITAAGYEAVDLLTEECEILRHGVMRKLSVVVRTNQKNSRLWS